MWFGKAVEDFNRGIQEAGNNAPQLIAATSNGFTSMFFYFEPKRTISHSCSGLGRLRVLCRSCDLCFSPATRNSWWQVLVIRRLYVFMFKPHVQAYSNLNLNRSC